MCTLSVIVLQELGLDLDLEQVASTMLAKVHRLLTRAPQTGSTELSKMADVQALRSSVASKGEMVLIKYSALGQVRWCSWARPGAGVICCM
jgi:hypothetical protein